MLHETTLSDVLRTSGDGLLMIKDPASLCMVIGQCSGTIKFCEYLKLVLEMPITKHFDEDLEFSWIAYMSYGLKCNQDSYVSS